MYIVFNFWVGIMETNEVYRTKVQHFLEDIIYDIEIKEIKTLENKKPEHFVVSTNFVIVFHSCIRPLILNCEAHFLDHLSFFRNACIISLHFTVFDYK